MDKVKQLAGRIVAEGTLLQATLSNPRKKEPGQASKVKVKPVMLKDGIRYQFAYTVGTKVMHENVPAGETADKLAGLMEATYKQGLWQTEEADYQVFVDKRGRSSILKKTATKPQVDIGHNRKKNYLLAEGTPVPFLIELGVMNAQGKVLAAKYDKFRQINRFLEMIDDVAPYLPADRKLRIIDFGCGKSYLTFALYHFLADVKKRDLEVIGLDLKEDVIAHCNALAGKLGCGGLRFLVGDIGRYEGVERVDMVVTLHACDTATDAALEKAVRWGADVILSVPCCQHELHKQIRSDALSPLLDHGILKERFAALATDAARAQLLELAGYRTQILEFIDMEHTPKNLLIRAVRQAESDPARLKRLAEAYSGFKSFLNIDPYLERALSGRLKLQPR